MIVFTTCMLAALITVRAGEVVLTPAGNSSNCVQASFLVDYPFSYEASANAIVSQYGDCQANFFTTALNNSVYNTTGVDAAYLSANSASIAAALATLTPILPSAWDGAGMEITYGFALLSGSVAGGWIPGFCSPTSHYPCDHFVYPPGTTESDYTQTCLNQGMPTTPFDVTTTSSYDDSGNVIYSSSIAFVSACFPNAVAVRASGAASSGWQAYGTNNDQNSNLFGPITIVDGDGSEAVVMMFVYTEGTQSTTQFVQSSALQLGMQNILDYFSNQVAPFVFPFYGDLMADDCSTDQLNDTIVPTVTVDICASPTNCAVTNVTLYPYPSVENGVPVVMFGSPSWYAVADANAFCSGNVVSFDVVQTWSYLDGSHITTYAFNNILMSTNVNCTRILSYMQTQTSSTLPRFVHVPVNATILGLTNGLHTFYAGNWASAIPWVGFFEPNGLHAIVNAIKALNDRVSGLAGGLSQLGSVFTAFELYVTSELELYADYISMESTFQRMSAQSATVSVSTTRLMAAAQRSLDALLQFRQPGAITTSDSLSLAVITEAIATVTPSSLGFSDSVSWGFSGMDNQGNMYTQPNAALWLSGYKSYSVWTNDTDTYVTIVFTLPMCDQSAFPTWLVEVNPSGFAYVPDSPGVVGGVYEDLSAPVDYAYCVCISSDVCYATRSIINPATWQLQSEASLLGRRQIVGSGGIVSCAATVAGVNATLLTATAFNVNASDGSLPSYLMTGPVPLRFGQMRDSAVGEVAACYFKVANGGDMNSAYQSMDCGETTYAFPLSGETYVSTVGLGTCVTGANGLPDYDLTCANATVIAFSSANRAANNPVNVNYTLPNDYGRITINQVPQPGNVDYYNGTAQNELDGELEANFTKAINKASGELSPSGCTPFTFWKCRFPANIINAVLFAIFICVIIMLAWVVYRVGLLAYEHSGSFSTPTKSASSTVIIESAPQASTMRKRAPTTQASAYVATAGAAAGYSMLPGVSATYIHDSDDAADVAGEIIQTIVLAYLCLGLLMWLWYVVWFILSKLKKRRMLSGVYFTLDDPACITDALAPHSQVVILSNASNFPPGFDPARQVGLVKVSAAQLADDAFIVKVAGRAFLYDSKCSSNSKTIVHTNYPWLIARFVDVNDFRMTITENYAHTGASRSVRNRFISALVLMLVSAHGASATRFEFTGSIFDTQYYGDTKSSNYDDDGVLFVRISLAIFVLTCFWIAGAVFFGFTRGFGALRYLTDDIMHSLYAARTVSLKSSLSMMQRFKVRTKVFLMAIVSAAMTTTAEAAQVGGQPTCGYWDWSNCDFSVWVANLCTLIVLAYLGYKLLLFMGSCVTMLRVCFGGKKDKVEPAVASYMDMSGPTTVRRDLMR